jgi:shikimate dehydrogenase
VDGSAEAIGSVNTIVNTGVQLRAYNTDYLAVAKLLADRQVPVDYGFAVLGSGGMAKAVVAALRDAGFHAGTVVARNPRTGAALAERYGYPWGPRLAPAGPAAGERDPGRDVGWSRRRRPAGGAGGGGCRRDRLGCGRGAGADPAGAPGACSGKQVITGAEVIALQAVEQFVLYRGVRPGDD